MAKKNKYSADQLYDSCMTSTEISCSKCYGSNNVNGMDEWEAIEHFFGKGWRATTSHTYCPECAKKHLKQ